MLKHKGDSVGLTTVYRTLQSLADAGEVDVLRTSDGESVYRRCSTGEHHHHLVCRVCGKAVEVEGPAVEKWAEAIAVEHGYVNVAQTAGDRQLRGVRCGQGVAGARFLAAGRWGPGAQFPAPEGGAS